MREKIRDISIVVVGYRADREDCPLYQILELPNDLELGATINRAFHDLDCDFISLRAIEKKRGKVESA